MGQSFRIRNCVFFSENEILTLPKKIHARFGGNTERPSPGGPRRDPAPPVHSAATGGDNAPGALRNRFCSPQGATPHWKGRGDQWCRLGTPLHVGVSYYLERG